MKRAPLRSDPEKVRAWNEKHRQAFAPRQGPPDRKPLARTAPKRPDPIPAETRTAARARSHGRCIVCQYIGARCGWGNGKGKADALHHALPKQRAKWPMLVAVEDNLVGVCNFHHDNHEHGGARIPLLALPECVFRLAADVGPAAVDYLLKTYPERGGSAQTT